MKRTIIVMMISCLLFGQVDYSTEIQEDIFDIRCTNCHVYGHNSGLDLESYDGVMAGGSSGAVIEPGDHANSYLWQRVHNGEMPPGNNPDLSADEIDLIAQWIDEGALQEPATTTAIYDIQYVSDPETDDASPLEGQEVTISGIVTSEFWGSNSNRYIHVQDAEGAWNGILCFNYDGWDSFEFTDDDGNSVIGPAEGDSVTLTGTVTEYYTLTELDDITECIVHGPANSIMPPVNVATGDVGEAYEGCLIAVVDATVDDPDLGSGEWSADDGSGSVRFDDKWDYFYYPEEGQTLAQIIGVGYYEYDSYRIQPRLARDVVEADGDPVRIQRVQQVLYSDLIKAGEDEVSDVSYMVGDTVELEGIVTMPTGLSYAGAGVKFIFEDENGGPWSGILSYDPDSSAFGTLLEGFKVIATGYISEYSTGAANMTELFITQPVQIISPGNELPPVDTVLTGDMRWPTEAEQWGTVMIRVEEGIVTDNDLQYEVFAVDDGSGEVLVDDDSDSIQVYFESVGPPPVGSLVQSIEGWLYHHYGSNADSSTYKLCPLYVDDIVFGAGPPAISSVSRDPCAPQNSDTDVTVSCVITDNSDIASAVVHYSIDGGEYLTADMNNTGDSTWTGMIPISAGNEVYYYIVATDDGFDQSEPKSNSFPYDTDHGQLGFIVTDDLTIGIVQETPWESGLSLYHGCELTLTGIVTGDTAQYNSGYGAYAFQDGTGQWNGLLFDGADLQVLSRGDEVAVTGTIDEFDAAWHFQNDGNTRLINVSNIDVLSTGNAEPDPALVSCRDVTQTGEEVESYEGVLVTLNNVTISAVNQHDWSITDATGSETLIDNDMATMAADNYMSTLEEGQVLESISGIFNFSFGTYKVQIRGLPDLGQTVGIVDDIKINPYSYQLYENFPNPFNPETQIRFEIGARENVQILIYDILGRQIRYLVNEQYSPGFHVVNWDGTNETGQPVSSGMYIYLLKAGDYMADKKMLFVK